MQVNYVQREAGMSDVGLVYTGLFIGGLVIAGIVVSIIRSIAEYAGVRRELNYQRPVVRRGQCVGGCSGGGHYDYDGEGWNSPVHAARETYHKEETGKPVYEWGDAQRHQPEHPIEVPNWPVRKESE